MEEKGKEINLDMYIHQRTTVLREELNIVKTLIKNHGPTLGISYETVLKKFLTEFLPRKVKTGSGFLFDITEGKCSKQMDIIIYSDLDIAPIYQAQDFVVVDYNTVDAIIEVKGTINSKTIKDARENLASAKEMLLFDRRWFLVGIRSELRKETVIKHTKEFLDKCSGLLVLNNVKTGQEYYWDGKVIFEKYVIEQFLKSIFEILLLAKSKKTTFLDKSLWYGEPMETGVIKLAHCLLNRIVDCRSAL